MSISLTIPAARVIRKPGVPLKIGFEYPREYDPGVEMLMEYIQKLNTQFLRVDISPVKRPRSTGKNSQNNHVWGHCADIANQLRDPATGEATYNTSEVEEAMKRMAVSEGYPTRLAPDGVEAPKPFRDATVEEAKLLLDVIHRFADEHSLALTETDDEGEYLSIGGRSRREMEKYVRS